jgi:hypothetical protein
MKKTVAYCKFCESICFLYHHEYTVDVQETFEWNGRHVKERELTPADQTFRDGTSVDRCALCGEEGEIIFLTISDEVAEFLLEVQKTSESVVITLTEEELDAGEFSDLTRLKKEVTKQALL